MWVGMTDPSKRRALIERYIEARRARPQARPIPSAGLAVHRVMKPLSKSKSGQRKTRGSSALALAEVWPDIMGPRWSKISTPVRFRASKQGRTLLINAPGPAASLILAASGPILERINTHYGSDYVQSLQVVQTKALHPNTSSRAKRGLTPQEEDRLQTGLGRISNPRLKKALGDLGREVMRNQP